MAIDLPPGLNTGPITHEPRRASVGRDQKKTRDCVNPVIQVFPPLNNQIRRNRDTLRQRRLDPRMNVNKVDGSRPCICEHTKIISKREYRIEGSQSVASRIVSAGDIRLDAETRL